MSLIDATFDAGGRALTVRYDPHASGLPVLVHPGTPGSRFLDPRQVDDAAAAGLRLIAWDRPGYGDTAGLPGRSVAQAAADAAAVADHLGFSRFTTWGFSGGGGFALACAALLPERVTAAVVLASLAPYTELGQQWAAHWGEEARAEVQLFFSDPSAARVKFRADAREMGDALSRPEAWLARCGNAAGVDEAHSREVADHLALIFRESLKNGDEGWWQDHASRCSSGTASRTRPSGSSTVAGWPTTCPASKPT